MIDTRNEAAEAVSIVAPVATPTPEAITTFAELDLAPALLAVLTKLGFVTPTPIQNKSIPVVRSGKDVIGIAQTGTGKTLAFGLPMLDRFVRNGNRSRGRGLVILPTRELALQVDETLRKVGGPFGLKTAVLIGGAPIRGQQAELRRNPDIVVATPGRLIDHLQSRMIDLRTVDTLILDEADRMLDMGFAPQIKQILREVPSERQTLLFSATMPDDIVAIANNHMVDPVRVEVARAGTAAQHVSQELYVVPQEEKNDLLTELLYDYKGTVLVFARTRSRAARVARTIKRLGHTSAEIHSDRSLSQRRAALDGFKNGTYRILVATDIAARGIDVTGIEVVINYDLPDCAEDYIHRIGRTGRAGREGHAISFAAPDQTGDVRDIEKLLRTEILHAEKSLYQLDPMTASSRSKSRRGRGGSTRPVAVDGARFGPRAAQDGARPTGRGDAPRSSERRNDGERPAAAPHNFRGGNRNFRSARPTSSR
jgi:ATP-dependent RNA helicase RhlE